MTAVVDFLPVGEYFSGLDTNDPDYVRQLLRPAAIKEDVKLMEQRQRVSIILRSPAFRKELERNVASQMHEGQLSQNVLALKQLMDVFTPHTKLGSSLFSKGLTVPVIPINDLRSQVSPYSKPEKIIRCKLASTYRLIDIFDWSSDSTNHISAKVFKEGDAYLFNPRGLLFNEITASSLVKVDHLGNILDGGSTGQGINKQGWFLHSSIYEALPYARCIVQLCTPSTIAVSCMKSGILPLSQDAMMLGKIAIYDPSSFTADLLVETNEEVSNEADARQVLMNRRQLEAAQESAAIKTCLTAVGEPKLLLIKKYGLLVIGRSIEEAWMLSYVTTSVCESQLRLACLGTDELFLPSSDVATEAQTSQPCSAGGSVENWKPGELEFEAMMRRLDSAGYHTGHLYRLSQLRSSSQGRRGFVAQSSAIGGEADGIPKEMSRREYAFRSASLGRGAFNRDEIEVPPSATSFAANYYTDDETRSKLATEHRRKTMSLQRTHWRTTPNAYKREEIDEVGTSNPKKIMHWTEGGKKTTGGTAIATEDPNQFAPQGEDPRELRENLKKVRDKYYQDVRTAGPQSKILDCVDMDDLDSSLASGKVVSPRGTLLRLDPNNPPTLEPGHVVMVGAVSKGIINRDQRHNVGLFQSVFSPNPFDQVTDDELDRYKRNVERKNKGMLTEEEEEALEQKRRTVPANFEHVLPEEAYPQKSFQPGATRDGVRSDLSGAELSNEEIGKKHEASVGKQKRHRFKMPFSRKGKDKKKETTKS